ncbi:PKD domain-containing protein [Candidatus Woesearchaeota archaeon]|nr:PKD domain-containing protein [Candidatus Woesearchaeota archaeon]
MSLGRKARMVNLNFALIAVLSLSFVLLFASQSASIQTSDISQYANPGFPDSTPVNVGDYTTLSLTWSTSENLTVIFCNNSDNNNCYYDPTGGQSSPLLCNVSNFALVNVTNANCTYQTKESDPSVMPFYARVYNSSQLISSAGVFSGNATSSPTPEAYIYVNHRPTAQNVSVLPSPAFSSSELMCGYDFYDQDGDSELVSSALFRWWLQNSSGQYELILGETSQNLSFTLNVSQYVICGVLVNDTHGFADDVYVNSSATVIASGNLPYLVNLTDDSNSTDATVLGDDVTFYVGWNSSNASISARAFVCNDSDITISGCGSGDTSYCTTSYETQDQLLSCTHAVNLSDEINNTYYVRVCLEGGSSTASDCSPTVMNGTFFRFNDTTAPSFNLSSVPNYTSERPYNLEFEAVDDYNLSITTLLVNVSNATSVLHFFNYSNFTCSGTSTLQTCNISLNLSDGNYNFNFSMEDSNGNYNATNTSLGVDAEPGMIPWAHIGYYQTVPVVPAVITNVKTLFFNWTDAVGIESGIVRYEYAVGTGATNGSVGWNSILDWTNATLNTSIFANLSSLVHGEVYYVHVRALANSGLYSNVTSSTGILYNDISAPLCVGDACILDDGAWNNSKTQLRFNMNFSAQGSPIVEYEYTLGNNTCYLPGYDSEVTLTNTSSAIIYPSGLSLQDNVTYYLCARARSANDVWSDLESSNGIRIDSMAPTNGSISYTNINLTTNTTTVFLYDGFDNYSGIASRVLEYSQVAYNPSQGCTGFGAWQPYNATVASGNVNQIVSLSHGYCYRFRYLVTDSAGNTQTYYYGDYTSFYVDLTPPENFTVNMNNGAFYTFSNNFILNWSGGIDPESGIDYYTYTVKDSLGGVVVDWTNTTEEFVLLNNMLYPDGSSLVSERLYHGEVIAYNHLGLPFNASSNTVLYLDNIPPDPVTIVDVAGDSNSTDGYYDFTDDGQTNVTVMGENGMHCVYSEYDIPYSTTYGTNCTGTVGNTSICQINVTDGNYTYYIACTDAVGNSQDSNQNTAVNFVTDNHGPNITSINPVNGSIVAGLVTVSASIVDAGIGIINASWYEIRDFSDNLNASGTLSLSSGSTYSASWDSSTVSQATYTLRIFANDSMNHSSNASVTFTINRDLPYLEVSHDDYSSDSTDEFNITIIAQVFTNVSYNVTNSSGSLVASGSNTTSGSANRNYLSWLVNLSIADTGVWAEGPYDLVVWAVNNNSNVSEANSSFIIDRYAPGYSNVLDTYSMTIYNNDSVNITLDWTDTNNISDVVFETNAFNGSMVNYTSIVVNIGDTYSLYIGPENLENNETVLWKVYAVDAAGHWNETLEYNFTVQNRNPIVNSSLPSEFNASKNVLYQLDIDTILVDYDLDNMTYGASGSGNISVVSLDQDTGILVLNFTANWTGLENISLNVTDPFGEFNETNISVNVSNDAPSLVSEIPTLAWFYNLNYTDLDVSDYLVDINGDDLLFNATYSANVTVLMNETSGEVIIVPDDGWLGFGWVIFNATDVENETTWSNNVTLIVYVSTENSTVTDSTVNGVYYSSNYSNVIPGISNSTVSSSNISGSLIVNSTLSNCTIIDSTVENAVLSDCFIDPSRIINSTLSENSSAYDSNVTDSILVNVSVNGTIVQNTTIYDTVLVDANVSDGAIYSGSVLMYNGSEYDASSSGAKNLTRLINYPPVAVIESATGLYAGSATTLTSGSTDVNLDVFTGVAAFMVNGVNSSSLSEEEMYTFGSDANLTVLYFDDDLVWFRFDMPGGVNETENLTLHEVLLTNNGSNDFEVNLTNLTTWTAINDSLTYTWLFGDGESDVTNSTSVEHTYAASGSYTVNLTVSDRYGRSSSVTYGITVSDPEGGSGNGGSSGGGIPVGLYEYEPPSRVIELDLSSGSATFELFMAANKPNMALFTFGSRDYEMTLTNVGSNDATIHFNSNPELSKKLAIGQSQVFDLNQDGVSDIEVRLMDMRGWTSGEFTMTLLSSPPESAATGDTSSQVTQPSTPPTTEQPSTVEPSGGDAYEGTGAATPSQWLTWLLLGLVVLIGGALLYSHRNAIMNMFAQQQSTPAETPASLQKLMREDEVDRFITDELSRGKNFHQILSDLEKNGWQHRAGYYKIARYVAREGIKEGKTFNVVYDDMLAHGWDQDIVTSILNESIMDEQPVR